MSIFKSTIAAENSIWLKNSIQKEFYLYFEIEAKEFQPSNKRIPLNISLVIDRSGSMSGEKLENVKKAVDFVIDNLSNEDYLSIVQYDNKVDVLSPSTKVVNKAELHQKVKTITAGGSTNLSGGMLEGYQQVDNNTSANYVNRVLLLSDGLANNGVTDPKKLVEISRKKFRELSIGLSTFGVGAGFNEGLMTDLAEHGGANYYFIDSPDGIPSIFAEELSGLLSVVSQNTKFDLAFPKEYFKCTQVFGYPFEVNDGTVSVKFNDVISEEKKAVLIKFENIKDIDQDLSFQTKLDYEDVVDKLERQQEKQTIKLKISEDQDLFKENRNSIVLEQIIYYTINDLYEQAINKADIRDFEGAKQIIAQAKISMETHFKSYPATAELEKLYKQILDYDKTIEDLKEMSPRHYTLSQKTSKSDFYSLKRKKALLFELKNKQKGE